MRKQIENELFLTKLAQIYQGTRAWGTVRVQVKRLFEERRQHKNSQRKARQADRLEDCKDKSKEFSLIVKAATPNRKVSTVVEPSQASSFEQKLTEVMQKGIFKQVLEKQEREKKEKKKGKAKKEEAKAGKGAGKKEGPNRIKKTRKERRKDLAKATKKVNLQRKKAQMLAAKEGNAPDAPMQQ